MMLDNCKNKILYSIKDELKLNRYNMKIPNTTGAQQENYINMTGAQKENYINTI